MISWKDPAEVVLTNRIPCVEVDERYATMEGVFNVMCKTPETGERPTTIDGLITAAFFKNKWLKIIITSITDGAWEKKSMDSTGAVWGYTIDNKTLLTIVSHVTSFYSTQFTKDVVSDATRTCDHILAVFETISDIKERKAICKNGHRLNTAFGQLAIVPQMLTNMYRGVHDGMTQEQIVTENLMLSELSEKHPGVKGLFEFTTSKVQKCKGILKDYMLTEQALKEKYAIPEDISVSVFLDDTPFKVKYLESKVNSLKATESGAIHNNSKKLPLAPKLDQLIEAMEFEERPDIGLTLIEIDRLRSGALDLFAENINPPEGVDNAMLNELTDQMATYVLKIAEEFTTNSIIVMPDGTRAPVRPMELFVLHSVLSRADQSAVTAEEAAAVQLSQPWQDHARATEVIRWLAAVQKEADAAYKKGGFYLSLQNMTSPVIKKWKNLLNHSQHVFSEVLDNLFHGIPYVKWDVLFIIAKAWKVPMALQSRAMFEASLDIDTYPYTLTSEQPQEPAEEEETDEEEEEQRGGGAASPREDQPPHPKRIKVVSPAQQDATVTLGRFITNIKWSVTGVNETIRDVVKTLLNNVTEETWRKVHVGESAENIMAIVYDDLDFDEFIIDAVNTRARTKLEAISYHVMKEVAKTIKATDMKKLNESLTKKYGIPA